MSKLTIAAKQIEDVAARLESRGHKSAPELRKIAQYINQMGMGDMEVGAAPYSMEGGAPNPIIQPFAQIKQIEPNDDREVHKAGVTFKAPKGVPEADIMHVMMDSVRDLGVEIDGFTWQRSESKSKN